MAREQRGIVTKAIDRRERSHWPRHGKAERDVVAGVVVLRVREDHIAAARLEWIRDLVVRVDDAGRVGRSRAKQSVQGSDRSYCASHARTSFCSCADPSRDFAN